MKGFEPSSADASQKLTIVAGGERFGLARSAVREVIRMPELTPVPHAPPGLLGVARVRAETLTIIAAGATTRAPGAIAKTPYLLILERDDRVGLAIDRIEPSGMAQGAAPGLPLEELVRAATPSLKALKTNVGASISSVSTPTRLDDERYLHVVAGGQSFCIPVMCVADIVKLRPPRAAAVYREASATARMGWRNRSLGLVELAALLGLETKGPQSPVRTIVVLEIAGQARGLEVEQACGLINVAPDRVAPLPPALLQRQSGSWFSAICRPTTGPHMMIPVLACDQIISAEASEDKEGVAASDVRDEGPTASRDHLRYVLVRIGPYRLGFPIANIRITALPQKQMSVPGSPPWLSGIAPDRGDPLAIVDPLLMWTGRPVEDARRVAIVHGKTDRLGLLVSEARDIIVVDPKALSRVHPPAPLADALGDPVRLTPEGVMLIGDTSRLVSTTEHKLTSILAAA